MKTSRIKDQKGFTLIEVSLAIVIGVIILAGAITLYNQSKLSAGNSKAQEKSLALASLAEEMAANNNGAYPQLAQLNTAWQSRRDDFNANPWGGSLGPGGAIYAGAGVTYGNYTWPSAANTGGYDKANTIPGGGLFNSAASAGIFFYAVGNGTSSVYDINALVPHTYSNIIVGLANNNGQGWAFTNGGK